MYTCIYSEKICLYVYLYENVNKKVLKELLKKEKEKKEVTRAGLNDNVPHRPSSAKVAPVGCQLMTMALDMITVTFPKGGLYFRSHHTIWDVSVSGLSCARRAKLADYLPPWQ